MKSIFYIKKNQEFRKIYQSGKSIADRLMVVYKVFNNKDANRYGFSVSKKIGNAVVRNRIKRILREICRLNNYRVKKGYDIVIIARNPIKDQKYHCIEKSLLRLFNKINILREEKEE